jgi:hypothetical protein
VAQWFQYSLVLPLLECIASGSGRSLGESAEADASQLAGLAAGAVEVFGLQKVFGPSWTRCGLYSWTSNVQVRWVLCKRCSMQPVLAVLYAVHEEPPQPASVERTVSMLVLPLLAPLPHLP